MLNFPKSDRARLGLAGVVIAFCFLGYIRYVGGPITGGIADALSLISLGAFGVWGIAAVILGHALGGSYSASIGLVIPFVVIQVIRLAIDLIIIGFVVGNPPTAARLVRGIPVVVLAAFVVQLATQAIYLTIFQRIAFIWYLLSGPELINLIVQIAIGYAVVLPLCRRFENPGRSVGTLQNSAPADATKSAAPDAAKAGYAVADYGVPHCHYEKTDEGFIVTFNKTHVGFHSAMDRLGGGKKSGVEAFGALIGLIFVAVGWGIHKSAGGTKIEVTRDAVIIDDKKMSRDDFGGFNVDSTFKGGSRSDTIATLGYQFGNRSFAFGGAWPEGQATEVASSLNRHLRRTPRAGDEFRASPEMLRAARPTDF